MNKKIFVNAIYHKHLHECKDRYIFLFGGAGSGKSVYSIQQFVIKFFLAAKNQRLFMGRKVARNIAATVWAPVVELLKDLGLYQSMDINKTNKTILDPVTGNEIIMMGMDDPEKVKSIHGITKVFLEEVSDYTEQDYLQIDMRMRGKLKNDDYYQLWASFNPVHDKHWLVRHVEPQYLPKLPSNILDVNYLDKKRKVWRFLTDGGDGHTTNTTVLNTTYHDNKKIDTQYIAVLRKLASTDENYYQVYERGRWGVINAGDAYCPAFKEAIHVPAHSVEYNPEHPLHYTLDFNTKPYMTGIVSQLIPTQKGWQINVIDELALSYPQNEAFYLGSQFMQRYGHAIGKGVYLYGDASGNNKLGVKDTKTLFQDVLNGFGIYANAIEQRIPRSNPRYDKIAQGALGRRTFLNALFKEVLPAKIRIAPQCVELIKDFRECRQDANGKLAKPKTNGIEERGHALQAFEYLVCHPDAVGYLAVV
jgi:phage terminase large subunit